jgi:hypothetical protein
MFKIVPQFDFEEALEALKAGQDLNGKERYSYTTTNSLLRLRWRQS